MGWAILTFTDENYDDVDENNDDGDENNDDGDENYDDVDDGGDFFSVYLGATMVPWVPSSPSLVLETMMIINEVYWEYMRYYRGMKYS